MDQRSAQTGEYFSHDVDLENGDIGLRNSYADYDDTPDSENDRPVKHGPFAAIAAVTSPGELPLSFKNELDQKSLLSYSKSKVSTDHSCVRNRNSLANTQRLKKYRWTILAAFGLLVLGIGFIVGSVLEFAFDREAGSMTRGSLFLICGLLLGPAGGFNLFYIYQAFRGVPGYHFNGIPSFDG